MNDVFASGFIPTNADFMLCWSKQQCDFFEHLVLEFEKVGEKQKVALVNIGNPKKSRYFNKGTSETMGSKRILVGFGGDYLATYLNDESQHRKLNAFVTAINSASLEVIYSLHQHDKRSNEIRAFFDATGWKNVDELKKSHAYGIDLAVGSSSSLLVETSEANIPTLEITDFVFKGWKSEGPVTVTLDEFLDLSKNKFETLLKRHRDGIKSPMDQSKIELGETNISVEILR